MVSALPAMISTGRKGVTSNWSNVPSSRSRATDMAVKSRVWSSVRVPIKLGIMCQRVSRFGLYHARNATRTCEPPWPWAARQSALNAVTTAPTYPSAVPAVFELRPSAITCTSADWPKSSLRSKS